MKKNITICVLLLLCSISASANEFKTASDLLHYCKSDKPEEEILCLGFITGFAQGHSIGAEIHSDDSQLLFCLPDEWTSGQGQAVFIRWAKNNPDKWHLNRDTGLALAFIDAFPC